MEDPTIDVIDLAHGLPSSLAFDTPVTLMVPKPSGNDRHDAPLTPIDYAIYDAPHGFREFGTQNPDGHDIAFGQPLAS